jgi:enoyl-CoA hydratase
MQTTLAHCTSAAATGAPRPTDLERHAMQDFFELTHGPEGCATLTLNRPERLNTLAPAFFPALRDGVQSLNDAGQTRVLVIRSSGKHFSAGMALDVFAQEADWLKLQTARQRLAFQDHLRRLMRCVDVLDEARFPVICAVQGGCIGGALDLAAACDIRLCTADAFFTVQEIHIGMAADLGVLQRLQRIVPQGLAREMAYTGERLGAERALASGLVNTVLPDAAALHAHAQTLAEQIAAKSPLAVAGSKRALNYARDHATAAALDQMTLLQSAIFDIEEMGQAIAGWKAKSAARFAPLGAVPPLETP